MLITQAQLADARRTLFASPSRDRRPADAIDFKVRPISEDWMLVDRMPAYKTAACNVAYIWRDSDVADRFGPMPPTFAERRYELRGSGLLLPQTAPLWATKDYQIWQDADQAALATGDPTAVSAWHVMLQIPETVSPKWWHWMLTGFLQKELAGRGAAVAWAIHALEGDDKRWLVSPHAQVCTYCFGIAVLRKRPVGTRGVCNSVDPIASIALREQPLSEGRLGVLLVVVIGHQRILRIGGLSLAPNRCSCNVLANQAGLRLAMATPPPR